MDFNSIKYKANYYVLLVLAFVIPLERKLIAPATILFLVTSLVNVQLNWKAKKNLLWFGVLYLLYAFGLGYSLDTSTGIKDLTTKLPLLLMPLGFFLADINFRKVLPNVLRSFIDGCLTSTLIALIYATVQYYFSADISNFFYGEVALFAHPSYLAMLLSLAIVVLYFFLLGKGYSTTLKPMLMVLLLVIFSVYILILASKTGLIAMVLCHGIGIGYWVLTCRKYMLGATLICGIVGLFVITYISSSTFKSRINELISLTETTDNEKYSTSTAARSIIWKVAVELIAEKPVFGHGTGDTKTVLINKYIVNGQDFLAKKQLNAHNQFLQTAIGIGSLGGLILLVSLLLPMLISLRQKDYLYFFFLCIILINFSTESMLERQVGVTFYALFNTLFFVSLFKTQQKVIK